MTLEQQHPEVAREFHKGNFVIHKSRRQFSAMAMDQAHEQNKQSSRVMGSSWVNRVPSSTSEVDGSWTGIEPPSCCI